VGVAAVAVGFSVYTMQENERLEADLIASEERSETATLRIAELEERLVAKLAERGTSAARISEFEGRALISVSEPEEALDVMARLRRAQEWQKSGKLEEALDEYLWLFDHGVKERRSFVGVRGSSVLTGILDIGTSVPRATREMEARRDRVEAQILGLSEDGDSEGLDIQAWASINRMLGDGDRLLRVFDQVSNKRLKRSLSIYLKDELVEAKRYAEALNPGSEGLPYTHFMMTYARAVPERFDSAKREQMQQRNKEYAIKKAAADLELLAGAGAVDQAIRLAEEVLVRDSSDETIALIRGHLVRAGKEELLEVIGR